MNTSFSVRAVAVSDADLETLQDAGDDAARFDLVRRLFVGYFGDGHRPAAMACAGGRVNLIGEHVDYPDVQFGGDDPVHLFSMGGAIQNNYVAAGSKRSDGRVCLVMLEARERMELALSDLEALEARAESDRQNALPESERVLPPWGGHSLGAVKEMVNRGVATTGLNLLLTSNVPFGAGMSNSAANCVSVGMVLNALHPELAIDQPMDLVTFARRSENSRFAGGQCGWLDQLLIVNSKADMLTKIDYADNGVEHFKSNLPEHMRFVAYNTNIPHVLAESDYGHRVKELTLGITFLSNLLGMKAGGPNFRLATLNALIKSLDPSIKPVVPPDILRSMDGVGDEHVCEFDEDKINEIVAAVEASFSVPADLPMHKGKTARESFAIIMRRMRHQKMSSLLVPLAGAAAVQGNADLFGQLLDMEGQSLRMSGDFMITGDNGAQDTMLDCAFEAARSIGIQVHGRMLGGGGGGNVLLFADSSNDSRFEGWEAATIAMYNAWAERAYPGKGIRASVITPAISAGARIIPIG